MPVNPLMNTVDLCALLGLAIPAGAEGIEISADSRTCDYVFFGKLIAPTKPEPIPAMPMPWRNCICGGTGWCSCLPPLDKPFSTF